MVGFTTCQRRTLLHPAAIDGCVYVPNPEDEPDNSNGSNAAEDHDLYAGYVYLLLLVLPIRSSSILVGVEHRYADPADFDLQSAGEKRLTH